MMEVSDLQTQLPARLHCEFTFFTKVSVYNIVVVNNAVFCRTVFTQVNEYPGKNNVL